MYAAVRQYEIGAGSIKEFMRIVDEGLAPILSEEPGFVEYHVIASGADEVVSVTLFDDEESVVRSNQIAAEFVRDRLLQFQVNLTSAMSGEVHITRTQAPSSTA